MWHVSTVASINLTLFEAICRVCVLIPFLFTVLIFLVIDSEENYCLLLWCLHCSVRLMTWFKDLLWAWPDRFICVDGL